MHIFHPKQNTEHPLTYFSQPIYLFGDAIQDLREYRLSDKISTFVNIVKLLVVVNIKLTKWEIAWC